MQIKTDFNKRSHFFYQLHMPISMQLCYISTYMVEAPIILCISFFPHKRIQCQHVSSKYVITKSNNPINLQHHLHILISMMEFEASI